jgi:hypothetical protein
MLVLITPTGSRPKQFELCMQWMKQQTYTGKVVWIVVDDCFPKTIDILNEDFRENWLIIKKYPKPLWEIGKNTQGRNLKIAIDIINVFPKDWVEAIYIIEDDDYYKPEYLQTMKYCLKGFTLAGEVKTVYYNIKYKMFKEMANTSHASLFQICFTADALPILEKYLNDGFIDINFCKNIKNINLFEANKLAIGIKGLPGRPGIGIGHRQKGILDINLNKLKELIGEDYKYYL